MNGARNSVARAMILGFLKVNRFTLDCAAFSQALANPAESSMQRSSSVFAALPESFLPYRSAGPGAQPAAGTRPQGRDDCAGAVCAEYSARDAEPEARAGAGRAGLRFCGHARGGRLERQPDGAGRCLPVSANCGHGGPRSASSPAAGSDADRYLQSTSTARLPARTSPCARRRAKRCWR